MIGGGAEPGFFDGIIDEVEIFERALGPNEVLAIYEAGSAGKCKPMCVEPPADMLAWWTGDDCGASDFLAKHHGTFVDFYGCPARWWVGDGAMAFPDRDREPYIRVLHDNDLNPGEGELSIDAWIMVGAEESENPIVSKGNWDEDAGYLLELAYGGLNFEVWGDDFSEGVYATEEWDEGSWHHVAAVLSRVDGMVELIAYIDGEARDTSSFATSVVVDPAGDLLIGAAWYSDEPEAFFDGIIDEVEIFGRALDADEIENIFLAGRAGKCKQSKKSIPAVSHWSLVVMTLLVMTVATVILGRGGRHAARR